MYPVAGANEIARAVLTKIEYPNGTRTFGILILMTQPKWHIEDLKDIKVVRDDKFEGGTKRRAFERLIDTIPESELVYACDYYGHAAYAIALTALDASKTVKLFYPSPLRETGVFKKTTSLPNVTYEIIEDADSQVEVSKTAIKYAREHDAKFLTIGLDIPEFIVELEKVVKSAQLDKAPELWCIGGSGTLARALKSAYPNIPVNVVSAGTTNANFEGIDKVYNAPEILDETAEVNPPYPSSPNYDAKTWRFVLEHAKPGAYVWNVA